MERNKQLHWMERLKARICDNRGVTLVELLVTLVILSILVPVVTGVMVAGQKTFMKQSNEVHFREDADYVTTMIMNEFFSTPFDYVSTCDNKNTCIEIEDSKQIGLSKYENNYKIEQTDKADSSPPTEIKVITANDKAQFDIGGAIMETESDFAGSTVRVDCSKNEGEKCVSGTISLNLQLTNPNTKQTLRLESRFGF
ncbi:PilW family protein [Bacillus sp. FJAT-42315]|uniref:PilW family protein n=1 Tax=Bacillus sp. FJAT-42315 TaxID=2014077 RepID=UPI0012FF2719|nr:prepilin-type N-terminal cleavage/methylation domain-containing protein [Bacillus sp. FJAT-42315]